MPDPEKDWREDIPIEALPASLQEFAKIIGVAATIKLAEDRGGLPFYLPKVDGLLRYMRNSRIHAECDGKNHNALALKYNLSRRQVEEILKDIPAETRQIDWVDDIQPAGEKSPR